jgi:hypothetical protein
MPVFLLLDRGLLTGSNLVRRCPARFATVHSYLSLHVLEGLRHCLFLGAVLRFVFVFNLSAGLEWKRVHYYCGHLLAYCSSPGWYMVMTVENLVEWITGSENPSTIIKPTRVPLCQSQIPHCFNRARTRAAAVGCRRLSASAATWLLPK